MRNSGISCNNGARNNWESSWWWWIDATTLYRTQGSKVCFEMTVQSFFIHQILIMLLGCVSTFNNLLWNLQAVCWREGVSFEFLDSENAACLTHFAIRTVGIVLYSIHHCCFHVRRTNNFRDCLKLFSNKLHQFLVAFLYNTIMVECVCSP